ncbi:MAG: response regulator [Proteobacteria bacterium]|nr:MAG: response regulator [Pseudomonadota bacterium]
MKVLIVEDDVTSNALITNIVSPEAQCIQAYNGVEAFKCYSDSLQAGDPFDLMFLDLMMPQMGGKELLSKIREFEQQNEVTPDRALKVVVLTAVGDEETEFELNFLGCIEYLVKPITVKKVKDSLKLAFQT